MLSAQELSGLRSTLSASMPDQVVVSRSTATSDGMGGQSEVWAAAGTVAARISPAGAGLDDLVGGEAVNVAPWVVTVPHGTNITDRDRIEWQGQTFEVIGVNAPRSWSACVRVECREVT